MCVAIASDTHYMEWRRVRQVCARKAEVDRQTASQTFDQVRLLLVCHRDERDRTMTSSELVSRLCEPLGQQLCRARDWLPLMPLRAWFLQIYTTDIGVVERTRAPLGDILTS